MNSKRLYVNTITFAVFSLFFAFCDVVFGNETNLTNNLIGSFFLAWNLDTCREDK